MERRLLLFWALCRLWQVFHLKRGNSLCAFKRVCSRVFELYVAMGDWWWFFLKGGSVNDLCIYKVICVFPFLVPSFLLICNFVTHLPVKTDHTWLEHTQIRTRSTGNNHDGTFLGSLLDKGKFHNVNVYWSNVLNAILTKPDEVTFLSSQVIKRQYFLKLQSAPDSKNTG